MCVTGEYSGVGVSSAATLADSGLKPLFRMAVVKGSAPTVLLHVRRGANVNARDERGLTPLMLAAAANRQDICLLLLAEGARAGDTTPDGRTAADLARSAGHLALCEALTPPARNAAGPHSVAERATASQQSVSAASLAFDDFASDGWEVEEEVAVGRSADEVLADARTVQIALGDVRSDGSPDWSDVSAALPAHLPDRKLSEAFRRWLAAASDGRVSSSELRRAARRLPGLSAVLEDMGVQHSADPLERFIDDVIRPRRQPERTFELAEEAAEICETLLDPRDSDRIRRLETDRLPRLDRSAEQSMFRALGDARRAVLKGLLTSAALVNPAAPQAAPDDAEPDDEPEDEASDFACVLAQLRDLGEEAAVERLAQLDLDIHLVEDVIALLARQSDPAADTLKLQLGRYLTARDRVVTAGLPWVEPCASYYARDGVDLGDLFQHGAIGLMRAAERFDPSLGHRFQTFAVWWIRQACTRAVADQSRTIRVPVHVQDTRRRLQRCWRELIAEGDPSPSLEKAALRADVSLERARRYMRLPGQVSLSRPELHSWSLRRPCPGSDAPFVAALENDRRRILERLVGQLPEREGDILRRRFGLGPFEAMTLEEVGSVYRVTRERIRQLERNALVRLGRGPERRLLRNLL